MVSGTPKMSIRVTSLPAMVASYASAMPPSAVKPGSMTRPMIANPTQGSAPIFLDAL